jgi:hypothetical protein
MCEADAVVRCTCRGPRTPVRTADSAWSGRPNATHARHAQTAVSRRLRRNALNTLARISNRIGPGSIAARIVKWQRPCPIPNDHAPWRRGCPVLDRRRHTGATPSGHMQDRRGHPQLCPFLADLQGRTHRNARAPSSLKNPAVTGVSSNRRATMLSRIRPLAIDHDRAHASTTHVRSP